MLNRPLSRAGQRHPDPVEPAGVRPGEQDPADRAEIGRDDEGAEHHQPDEALGRHVGARHRPGDRHAEHGGEHRDAGAELQRVPQRLQVARAAVGLDVVGEREAAGLGLLEARDDQPHHRAQRSGRPGSRSSRATGSCSDRRSRKRRVACAAGVRWSAAVRHEERPHAANSVCSPPPCGGGVRGGGPSVLRRRSATKLRPHSLALPRKGGGSTPSVGRGHTPSTAAAHHTPNVSRHCLMTSGMPLVISSTVGRMVFTSLADFAPAERLDLRPHQLVEMSRPRSSRPRRSADIP